MQRRFDTALQRIAFPDGRQPSFLLGVSGGVDSMTMLHLFLNSACASGIAVAHMNFSLRGEESDGDEAFVRGFCAGRGIRFLSKRVDTRQVASSEGISIEMAARKLRYEWFDSLLDELQLDYLAVAHNLNDSVETMYLNLLRGTGLKGISGIRPLSGRVFRPMLEFSRAEIESFAAERGIGFRVDSTNLSSDYSRNRIRNEVFPHFRSINPSFLETLSADMKRFREAEEIISEELQVRRESFCSRSGDSFQIDIQALQEGGHPAYWLFNVLEEYGFNSSQVDQMVAALEGGSGRMFHSPTHTIVKDRKYLKLYPASGAPLRECVVRVFDRTPDFNPKNAPEGVLYADADLLHLPLRCRRWCDADRFRPLGMTRFRKVSDFFSDIKLDVLQKRSQTIVTDVSDFGEERIVCILGLRLDDRFRITSETEHIAEIR